jgi:hypothetical protein
MLRGHGGVRRRGAARCGGRHFFEDFLVARVAARARELRLARRLAQVLRRNCGEVKRKLLVTLEKCFEDAHQRLRRRIVVRPDKAECSAAYPRLGCGSIGGIREGLKHTFMFSALMPSSSSLLITMLRRRRHVERFQTAAVCFFDHSSAADLRSKPTD